jgi:hypothetical protein
MHALYLLWFVHERQLSPALVAAVLAAGDFAIIIFELPTGWFADRLGHRASLVLGSIVQIAGMLSCWLLPGTSGLLTASVLVALGDAFRSGAHEALLYRSCIALEREDAFQRIEARTHAVERIALVVLVLGGGALVHTMGYPAGWAAEALLCTAGLGLALLMIEPPRTDACEGEARMSSGPAIALWMMALVLPAAMLGAGSSAASFVVQTTATTDAARMSMIVAAIALAEAAGSACAMRLPGCAVRTQWVMAAAGLVASIAGWMFSSMLLPALGLSFLAGIAHPLRAATIQRVAADGYRARAASAASACDMLVSTTTLPLTGIWLGKR